VYGNFAKTLAAPQTGDSAFDRLDFNLIYHDGALAGSAKEEVNNIRMSEVVVRDQLDLQQLAYVVCRTQHEARSLEYVLHKEGIDTSNVIVEQHGSVFMRKGIFLDEIYTMDGELFFKFHAPVKAAREKYDVRITKIGHWTRSFSLEATKWRISDADSRPDTVWQVDIEGCLAYVGTIPGDMIKNLILP